LQSDGASQIVVLACAATFLDALQLGAITPLLPTLKERFALSPDLIGLLTASWAIALAVVAIPAAQLTGRLGPRRSLAIAMAVLGASSTGLALGGFDVVLGGRALQGLASGLGWTAALVWVMSSVPFDARAKPIGYVYGAAFVGFTAGPVLGSLAVSAGMAPVFGGVAVAAFVLIVYTLRLPETPAPGPRPAKAFLHLVMRAGVSASMWVLALPGIFNGLISVVGSLELHARGADAAGIAIVYVLAALGAGFSSALLGRLTLRLGPARSAYLILVVTSAAALVLLASGATLLLALGIIGVFAGGAALNIPGTAMLTAHVEASGEDQEVGFGLLNLAFAPGHIVGATLGGLILDLGSPAPAYLVVLAVCAATAPAVGRAAAGVPRTS
jgi:MFS transporter, YNFM family, putative membrane transport protein